MVCNQDGIISSVVHLICDFCNSQLDDLDWWRLFFGCFSLFLEKTFAFSSYTFLTNLSVSKKHKYWELTSHVLAREVQNPAAGVLCNKSGFDNGIAAECIQKQPQQMRSRSRAIHSTQTSDPSIYFPPKTERSLHGFRVFFSCLITQASLHPLCHGQWSCWRCSDPQSGGEELEAPSAEG